MPNFGDLYKILEISRLECQQEVYWDPSILSIIGPTKNNCTGTGLLNLGKIIGVLLGDFCK